MLWAIPWFAPRTLQWNSFQKVFPSSHPPQMSVVLLNDPDIFAYSVCFKSGIAVIQAHIRGKEADFYHLTPQLYAVWLYAPVDQGEYILQIWKRQGLDTRDQALLVSTGDILA